MTNVHFAEILFVMPPEMKQPTDISPYVNAFAALLRKGFAFPPAPRLFKAVQIPGSQNATSPTMTIWNRTDR